MPDARLTRTREAYSTPLPNGWTTVPLESGIYTVDQETANRYFGGVTSITIGEPVTSDGEPLEPSEDSLWGV